MSSGPTYPPSLAHVPDIDFCVKDPAVIETEMIADAEAKYFELTGKRKVLAPADPVRMTLLTLAQEISQLRVIADFTGKQNLLKYAVDAYLDNVAALYGPRADRIDALPAQTILEFTLTLALNFDAVIPVGTKAGTVNELVFETTEAIVIRAGTRSGSSPAKCTLPGRIGNGYVPGQVSSLIEWNQPWGVNVRNTTETADGADAEYNDRYRYRTWLTPESFSTCGPEDAYRYWALRAHPDIIQCVVYSAPDIAGEVHLYPLLRGGIIPSSEIIAAVQANCRAIDRRPVTDFVTAFAATEVSYDIELYWWATRANEVVIAEIIEEVNQAVDDWALWQRAAIGRDIIDDELVARVIRAGAKRVSGPGGGPGVSTPIIPAYRQIGYNQLPVNPPDDPDQPPVHRIVEFVGFENE